VRYQLLKVDNQNDLPVCFVHQTPVKEEAVMAFNLVPADVPNTTREGEYVEIVHAFLDSGLKSARIELDKEVDATSITSGLKRAIKTTDNFGRLKVVQRKEEVYLELCATEADTVEAE
jgi:hypothetical protein